MPKHNDGGQTGNLMAECLRGSWRSKPPLEPPAPDKLSDIVTPLMQSGTAGLIWRRYRLGASQNTEVLAAFQQAYTYYTIRAGYHESQARNAFTFFRANGIEPILVKGWSIGRHYPAKGLRPYGDIDLCVSPKDYQKACDLEATAEGRLLNIDLHKGLEELDSRAFDEVFARTQLIQLNDTAIRVPSDEDLLRIVCFHLLKHGGWRPLHFCDVALLLETRSPEFRWEVCIENRREINWLSTTIGLAHRLLDADLTGYPYAAETRAIPRWMSIGVLKSWETPDPADNPPDKYGKPIREYLREPNGLWRALKSRWPNPIEATYSLNGSFNGMPRLPYQLADTIRRAVRFLTSLA